MTQLTTQYEAWRNGALIPGRITLARGYRGLTPTAIANACGTDCVTVDLWEQGIEYPSWQEAEDLYAVTSYPSSFFRRPVSGPGALFALPEGWHEDQRLELQEEFDALGVAVATRGWPRTLPSEAEVAQWATVGDQA